MLDVQDGWGQAELADQAKGVQAELGWVLHPDYAGHGYATEAVRELLRLCFDELGLRRVNAGCFAANTASWLMERVGVRRELYAVAESLHRSGGRLDGDVLRASRPRSGRPPFEQHAGTGGFGASVSPPGCRRGIYALKVRQ